VAAASCASPSPDEIVSMSSFASSMVACVTVTAVTAASSSSDPRSASRWFASVYRPRMRSCACSRPNATLLASSTATEFWFCSSLAMLARTVSA
jgi:hypothetical protein